MATQSTALSITRPSTGGPDELKMLSGKNDYVFFASNTPYYKTSTTQAVNGTNKCFFAIIKSKLNYAAYKKDNMYQLYGSLGTRSNPTSYYKVGTNTNIEEFLHTAVKEIESELYNGIYADFIFNNIHRYIIWYDKNRTNSKQRWRQLKESEKGGPQSETPFYQLKIESGATKNKGNGFFYNAGVFEDGVRDTSSNRYFVINWAKSQRTGAIQAIGTGGDVLNSVTKIMQTNNGPSNATQQYVLLQIDGNSTFGYKVIYGSLEKTGQVSLQQIQSFLNNQKNDINLDTSVTNGGSWGSSGNYSSNYSSAQQNPITGIVKNSTAQIEYIKDFPNYILSFKAGLDKRSIITDPFENRDDKIISTTEKQGDNEADVNNLILKIKISDQQINSASSGMTLSDKYYLYTEINSNSNITEKDFFTQIDDILNLNFEDTNSIWKDDKIPFSEDDWSLLPQTVCAIKKDTKEFQEIDFENDNNITLETIKQCEKISLSDFIVNKENRTQYKLLFFDINIINGQIQSLLSKNTSLSAFLEVINPFVEYVKKKTYSANFIFQQNRKSINLYSLELFEAYTRGHDFIQENYTTVRAKETLNNNKRVMNFDDNYFVYKYSGRDFDIMRKRNDKAIFTFSNGVSAALVHECDLLMETDVTLGDAYGQKKYFIEYIKYKDLDNQELLYKDTFKIKNYVEAVGATKYIEEDLDIVTSTIDLTQCEYYNPTAATYENQWCDCKFGTGDKYEKECIYQKLGYCPYRFQTEKHPRRIRTLSQEKSNRFNIIQELSKVFKIYPQFYIEFDKNGKILLDENGRMKKHIFFMTEKGNVNQLGFRYEKNLADISRTVDSTSLTTKLFVENIDSELSKTGLCSIQTAEDNISKTSYILDFSYYTKMNILNKEQVIKDLYGINKGDFAFLPTIGYYNNQYDKLTNLIINLTGETMVKLEAENETYIQGVTTALEEKQKICQKMYQFKVKSYQKDQYDYTTSDSYKNYLIKMKEQSTILWGQIETLFFTDNFYNLIFKGTKEPYIFKSVEIGKEPNEDNQYILMINKYKDIYCKGELFWRLFIEGFENEEQYKPLFNSWIDFKEKIIDTKLYPINGSIGQYNEMFNQVKKWKTERAKWLNKINDISEQFYKKYEPFIKEGTWTDNNYLTDNEYYWAAINVLNDSSQPKITYTLKVVNLSVLDEDYKFELADTSFVEDIDFFGINYKTGLPNRQKVLVSGLTYDLDIPSNDDIEVKNYTSSFEELFQTITASVQSLTFNENTYKRASNFTAMKYISKEALQGTLFDGDLTLVDTYSEDIIVDDKGIQGKNIANSALGYKLDGEGLSFTKDNGQTYDIGVGPNGINADYIKFGQLDASKIQIVDGNYIYFLWDKDGINAYRNPATSTNGLVDFARFNKYGLSLIENNNIRLRAGYEFKNDLIRNTSGNYNTELELEKQNIGFYLYNDSGQAIFKTETASDYSGVKGDYSARLSLTGEMFITNKVLEGENDGSIISKTPEMKLTGGWVINSLNIPKLYQQKTWKNVIQQQLNKKPFSLPQAEFVDDRIEYIPPVTEGNIIIENDENTEDNLTTINIIVWKIKSENLMPAQIDYSYNEENDTITKIDNSNFYYGRYGYEIYNIELNENEYEKENDKIIILSETIINKLENQNGFYTTVELYIKFTNEEKTEIENVYTTENISVNLCTKQDPVLMTTVFGQLNVESVTFYNVINSSVGDIIQKSIEKLYSYQIGLSNIMYNYWTSMEYTGNYQTSATSDISTEEVGIFINNKNSINDKKIQSNNRLSINKEEIEEDNTEEIQTFANSNAIDIFADDFVIIGDSITEGLNIASSLKDNAYGIGSSNFNSNFPNIPNKDKKTKVAFFLGMNQPSQGDELAYQKAYMDCIKKTIDGMTQIESLFVISITALDESKGGSDRTTENILECNQYISNMKEKMINNIPIQYIDIYEGSKNLAHSDKVHFTPNGYEGLCQLLKTAFSDSIPPSTNEITSSNTSSSDPGAALAAETALGGAERVFTIALKGHDDLGNTAYKNVLTVLKNGYLYMGGTITDFYGNTLSLSGFNLLPDEIRIAKPEFILSNSGYIWMNFNKTYPIWEDGSLETGTSLLDMLNSLGSAISGGSGSISGSGLPSGYYLIDPLAD